MFDLILSGGWMMLPILLCSVVALAISLERLWALKPERILPENLLIQVWELIKNNKLTSKELAKIKQQSPLGRILAAGLSNSKFGREVMKESIEEAANHVVHEMEKYLNFLGTIAAITPLLGLLGTVIGMIRVFTAIMLHGSGNASVLAGGISEALITTAAGLTVAIPSLVAHRFFQRRIDTLVVGLEQESLKLVEVVHGERELQGKD
ncbi:MAG: MotA/TolQ/ExbB proton channel family protein [Pseudomonadales bacterium]|nr:MotA/TolQ/ExbB proton channel family protein [Pseudomonadales bacterium]